jgi:hypothetical protein
MFFILGRIDRSDPEHIIHHQLGIVVADSPEAAAEKVGLAIVDVFQTMSAPENTYVTLELDYWLDRMAEVTKPIDKENVRAAVPTVVDDFVAMVLTQRAEE